MVDDPVNDQHRHVVVLEELAPVGEVLVSGQDDRPVCLQAVDQLEVQQGIHLTFGNGGLVPVVEALQALLGRERGHLPVSADALVPALDQFVFGKSVREAQVGHLVVFCLRQ